MKGKGLNFHMPNSSKLHNAQRIIFAAVSIAAILRTLWQLLDSPSSLNLSKGSDSTLGLCQSVLAILLEQSGGALFWTFQPNTGCWIWQSRALPVPNPSHHGSFPALLTLHAPLTLECHPSHLKTMHHYTAMQCAFESSASCWHWAHCWHSLPSWCHKPNLWHT